MKPGGQLKRRKALGPGKKAKENMRKYGTAIRPESKSPARRQEKQADAEWSLRVRTKYGGACVLCGEWFPVNRLHAHHCFSKSVRPEWRWEEWVGVPL